MALEAFALQCSSYIERIYRVNYYMSCNCNGLYFCSTCMRFIIYIIIIYNIQNDSDFICYKNNVEIIQFPPFLNVKF